MWLKPVGSVIAKLVTVLVVAAGAPALVAGSAQAAPGATPQDPVVLTSLSQLPAGAVVLGSTVDQCATLTTWSVTTPGVNETTRSEYRWPLDVRTYTPAVEEVKEYTYKKPKYRTEYRFKYQKQVSGKIQKYSGGYWNNYSTFGYEWWQRPTWETDGSFKWGDWNVTVDVLESGAHSSTSNTWSSGGYSYRKVSTAYRYYKTATSESQVVPDGYTYLDWTTDVLGAPWIKTGERVKVAGQPAVLSPWVFDELTAWSPSPAAPADPDGQAGEDNPLNLRRVGTPMETRTLGNGDAIPEKVTYYRYSDGKVCATIAPPPPPPTTVVPPPPVVEILGEQAGRATGKLYTSCQRTVRVTMKNGTAETVAYKIKVGKKTTIKRVKSDSTRVFTTTGQYRDLAKLMLGNRVLAMKRVPKPCAPPEVLPATGKRQQ